MQRAKRSKSSGVTQNKVQRQENKQNKLNMQYYSRGSKSQIKQQPQQRTSLPKIKQTEKNKIIKEKQMLKKLDKQLLVVRKQAFQRMVRQNMIQLEEDLREENQERTFFRFNRQGLYILQQVLESKQIDLITDSLDCANHAKRVTLMKKDIALARRIRGNEKLTSLRLF